MAVVPVRDAVRHIVLWGPMGAGKSTVGRLLAELLGFDHIDTDDALSTSLQAELHWFIRERGLAAFREEEQQVALAELERSEPTVISFGGGTLLSEDVRRRCQLADVTTVYLKVSEEVATARLSSDYARPLLDGPSAWSSLLAARRSLYETARLTVDTTLRAPEECAALIAAAVRSAEPWTEGAP